MEHIWIIGFACGAGMVNGQVGWGVMFVCSIILQLWK